MLSNIIYFLKTAAIIATFQGWKQLHILQATKAIFQKFALHALLVFGLITEHYTVNISIFRIFKIRKFVEAVTLSLSFLLVPRLSKSVLQYVCLLLWW